MNKNFSCRNRIKELRLERSLSQERVALNAGITSAYLGLLERGKRNATAAVIERICHFTEARNPHSQVAKIWGQFMPILDKSYFTLKR